MAKSQTSNGEAGKASNWAQSLKKSKTWTEARKAKGGNFDTPDIEDGRYHGRLTLAKCGVTKGKKGRRPEDDVSPKPYVVTAYKVLSGDYSGTRVQRSDFLTDDDSDRERMAQENFAKTMQGLGYETADLKPEEIPDLVEELNKSKPYVEFNIKNWKSDSGKSGINVYVNRVLTEEEVADLKSDSNEDEARETQTSRSRSKRSSR